MNLKRYCLLLDALISKPCYVCYIWALHGLSCQNILDLKRVVIKIANRCKLKSTRKTSAGTFQRVLPNNVRVSSWQYGMYTPNVHIQRNTITNMWKWIWHYFYYYSDQQKKNSWTLWFIYIINKYSKVSKYKYASTIHVL